MNIPEAMQSLVNFKTEDLLCLKQNINNKMNSGSYLPTEINSIISIRDTINSIIEGRRDKVAVLHCTGNNKKDKILELLNDVEVSGIKNIEKLSEVIKIIKSL